MWLKKFLLRRKIKRVLKREIVFSRTTPNRQLCEELLLLLTPEMFQYYRPAIGRVVPIVTCYGTINQLTETLKSYNLKFQQNEFVSPPNEILDEIKTDVDSFLVSKEGFYFADLIQPIELLKKEGLAFCDYLRPADQERVGHHSYHLRITTRVSVSLLSVTVGLLQTILLSLE